jgi:hypothetical protein
LLVILDIQRHAAAFRESGDILTLLEGAYTVLLSFWQLFAREHGFLLHAEDGVLIPCN